ncbi:MAG: metallophosphoesterase [Lachnospiraceae bacterium]|nr:metallophosphoesterase [Lachnospiraceae bacterium]
MAKVFVVPDVHLKPWMFEEARAQLSALRCDRVVLLGDLVDDWFCEKDYGLYRETLKQAVKFIRDHDALFCYGNHDLSYKWEAEESGYSPSARQVVLDGLSELEDHVREENLGYIHRIDNTLFSHGGLIAEFVDEYLGGEMEDLDEALWEINQMSENELWQNESPIWTRPQDYEGYLNMYPEDLFQVVGHTPVPSPTRQGRLLTLDTFSTMPSGKPIGDQRFVIVDTVDGSWCYADEQTE